MRIYVETRMLRPGCGRCGTPAVVKDRPLVELVDLCAFGRPARLVWRKYRWACSEATCPTGTWTGQEPRITAARLALTDRAGRWVTFQVGKHGRTVTVRPCLPTWNVTHLPARSVNARRAAVIRGSCPVHVPVGHVASEQAHRYFRHTRRAGRPKAQRSTNSTRGRSLTTAGVPHRPQPGRSIRVST